MGLKRWLWSNNPIGKTVQIARNIGDEGSITGGLKKTIKQAWCEDDPISSRVYGAGKYEGKKEGYVEASNEYEKKLLEQADFFLKKEAIFENERNEYEALLDDYEKEIENLSAKVNRTEEENQYLQQLLLKERKLRQMKN